MSTTCLLGTKIATVTGNQLLNANLEGLGLLIAMADQQFPKAAITGNVLNGRCMLPARNLGTAVPPPMNSWEFMNTLF